MSNHAILVSDLGWRLNRGGNGSDSALPISVSIFSKRIQMQIHILLNMNAERMLLEYRCKSDVLSIRNGYE
jgi:hypothetical protein